MNILPKQLALKSERSVRHLIGSSVCDDRSCAMGTIDHIYEKFGNSIVVLCPVGREDHAVFALEVPLDAIEFFKDLNGSTFGRVDGYDATDLTGQTTTSMGH